ncbi:PAS domain-containing protein [Rhodovulum sp. 12E13]|uniref:PAS domain-containing protein n=1 Tax=Rhodovulum sp. 12E13 TaxID=2203891 RepID=UPI001F1C90CE|nr:PAS domain-containing protein [Rhodovulum sp. 12E13]
MADQGAEGERDGAEVVSLAEVAKDMRFPVLGDLESYWQGLRGDRLLPARSEVDPRRIEDALEYAFILERIAPGMARFRLAGMHLNDLMGMEVRGMPLTSFFVPEARKRVSAALEQVFDAPAIARMSLAGESGIGRPGLDARLLLLPLKSDFGDVSRALGCLSTVGPVGRAPRRFTITTEQVECIAGPEHRGDRRIGGWSRGRRPSATPDDPSRGGTGAGPAPRQRAPGDAPRPGFFDPAAPYVPDPVQGSTGQPARPPRAEGRPHLYIVKSDTDE